MCSNKYLTSEQAIEEAQQFFRTRRTLRLAAQQLAQAPSAVSLINFSEAAEITIGDDFSRRNALILAARAFHVLFSMDLPSLLNDIQLQLINSSEDGVQALGLVSTFANAANIPLYA